MTQTGEAGRRGGLATPFSPMERLLGGRWGQYQGLPQLSSRQAGFHHETCSVEHSSEEGTKGQTVSWRQSWVSARLPFLSAINSRIRFPRGCPRSGWQHR